MSRYQLFKDWIIHNLESLNQDFEEVEFHSEGSSGFIQVLSLERIGRLTVWDEGNAYLSVMEIESEKNVIDEHLTIANQNDLTKVTDRLLNAFRSYDV